ncbi:MAG: hypothetical protein QNJ46_08665 [Leptolyngbyaceae cyanobacterium MO_188.B28]|nr:hypothetical protein [Leptolyngbyaceae cyanobacterium MO_188.B28]
MLKQTYTLGLLSLAALGLVSLPAQADTAVVQQSTQDLYIYGEGNSGTQVSEQINIHQRVNTHGRRSNTGIVQDVYQGATVVGEDNDAYQGNSQINVTEEVNRTHNRRHHRGQIRIRNTN